jgi:hypothetical protein
MKKCRLARVAREAFGSGGGGAERAGHDTARDTLKHDADPLLIPESYGDASVVATDLSVSYGSLQSRGHASCRGDTVFVIRVIERVWQIDNPKKLTELHVLPDDRNFLFVRWCSGQDALPYVGVVSHLMSPFGSGGAGGCGAGGVRSAMRPFSVTFK